MKLHHIAVDQFKWIAVRHIEQNVQVAVYSSPGVGHLCKLAGRFSLSNASAVVILGHRGADTESFYDCGQYPGKK